LLKTKGGKAIKSAKDLPDFKDLDDKFKNGKNAEVKIGFPASNSKTQSSEDDGVTALYKATVNNFGLGVPKRPFMSVAFAQNLSKYKKLITDGFKDDFSSLKILKRVGVIGQSDVQRTITNFKSPPNSEATIKAKGDNNPLIDSSHMVQSVSHAVEVAK
jgi:hypothetical protein